MGKLIKNHWGRLIVLTAATIQLAAAVEGFFWPKILWDFLTKNLDGAVKPFPTLQIFNLVFSFVGLGLEWPLGFITKMLPGVHRSIEARFVIYPLFALTSLLQYQSTNAGLYYLIGVGVYFWAFLEGEVSQRQLILLCSLLIMFPDRMPGAMDTAKKTCSSTRKGIEINLHHQRNDICRPSCSAD
jgi:hypothetical protein